MLKCEDDTETLMLIITSVLMSSYMTHEHRGLNAQTSFMGDKGAFKLRSSLSCFPKGSVNESINRFRRSGLNAESFSCHWLI